MWDGLEDDRPWNQCPTWSPCFNRVVRHRNSTCSVHPGIKTNNFVSSNHLKTFFKPKKHSQPKIHPKMPHQLNIPNVFHPSYLHQVVHPLKDQQRSPTPLPPAARWAYASGAAAAASGAPAPRQRGPPRGRRSWGNRSRSGAWRPGLRGRGRSWRLWKEDAPGEMLELPQKMEENVGRCWKEDGKKCLKQKQPRKLWLFHCCLNQIQEAKHWKRHGTVR